MTAIRAAIYVRVSTKPQAGEDKISIPDQIRECRGLAQREGWRSVGEFIDPGISANTIERPGLKKLLASLDQFDLVIAWDFDRYYRERRSVAGYILDTLDEHKKQITSVKQPIPVYDPSSYDPRENDTPYMLREMAGFTSGIDNRRRYRTLQKGLKERFKQGYMQKHPPYGYRIEIAVENGKVVRLPRQIVPHEAEVVRRMFREYTGGRSYLAIAKGLNLEGIPARNRPYWSGTTVCNVVRSPVYSGNVYRCHRIGSKRRLPENEWTILPGKHQAIVSEELWQKAQIIRRQKHKHPRASGTPFLLSGLVRCGYCNAAMCKDGGWGGGYYICVKYKHTGHCRRNGYLRLTLERDVTAFVLKLIREQDLFDKVRTRQEAAQEAGLTKELKQLETQLAQLPKRRERLFDLYECGLIEQDEFVERKDAHDRLQEQCLKEVRTKRETLEEMQNRELTRERFERNLATLEVDWKRGDIRKQKVALAALVDAIIIKDNTFKIRFKVGPEINT